MGAAGETHILASGDGQILRRHGDAGMQRHVGAGAQVQVSAGHHLPAVDHQQFAVLRADVGIAGTGDGAALGQPQVIVGVQIQGASGADQSAGQDDVSAGIAVEGPAGQHLAGGEADSAALGGHRHVAIGFGVQLRLGQAHAAAGSDGLRAFAGGAAVRQQHVAVVGGDAHVVAGVQGRAAERHLVARLQIQSAGGAGGTVAVQFQVAVAGRGVQGAIGGGERGRAGQGDILTGVDGDVLGAGGLAVGQGHVAVFAGQGQVAAGLGTGVGERHRGAAFQVQVAGGLRAAVLHQADATVAGVGGQVATAQQLRGVHGGDVAAVGLQRQIAGRVQVGLDQLAFAAAQAGVALAGLGDVLVHGEGAVGHGQVQIAVGVQAGETGQAQVRRHATDRQVAVLIEQIEAAVAGVRFQGTGFDQQGLVGAADTFAGAQGQLVGVQFGSGVRVLERVDGAVGHQGDVAAVAVGAHFAQMQVAGITGEGDVAGGGGHLLHVQVVRVMEIDLTLGIGGDHVHGGVQAAHVVRADGTDTAAGVEFQALGGDAGIVVLVVVDATVRIQRNDGAVAARRQLMDGQVAAGDDVDVTVEGFQGDQRQVVALAQQDVAVAGAAVNYPVDEGIQLHPAVGVEV